MSRIVLQAGWCVLCMVACAAAQAQAPELPTREQALASIEQPDAPARLAGIERLAQIGAMRDADALVPRLADPDAQVRATAAAAMWQIWSRSGDAAIDSLFARGVEEMQTGHLGQALATFSDIIEKRPDFAEGWNKRATVNFLLGRNAQSLRDCDEVFKRNPNHFGALSGAAQIHLILDDPQRALQFFQRALKINPGLPGAAQATLQLQERLRNQQRGMI